MSRFRIDKEFTLIASLLSFIFIVAVAVVLSQESMYKEFLKECRQDHKVYECIAMWRGQ